MNSSTLLNRLFFASSTQRSVQSFHWFVDVVLWQEHALFLSYRNLPNLCFANPFLSFLDATNCVPWSVSISSGFPNSWKPFISTRWLFPRCFIKYAIAHNPATGIVQPLRLRCLSSAHMLPLQLPYSNPRYPCISATSFILLPFSISLIIHRTFLWFSFLILHNGLDVKLFWDTIYNKDNRK